MSPAKMGAQRVMWGAIVAGFLALAVAAPLEMMQFRADSESAAGGGGPATITMASLMFQPPVLAVRSGTEVVFENADVAPHTVTDAVGTAFDSGTLSPRKVFKLVVRATVEYACIIHPTMRGKIILTG